MAGWTSKEQEGVNSNALYFLWSALHQAGAIAETPPGHLISGLAPPGPGKMKRFSDTVSFFGGGSVGFYEQLGNTMAAALGAPTKVEENRDPGGELIGKSIKFSDGSFIVYQMQKNGIGTNLATGSLPRLADWVQQTVASRRNL